MILKIYTPDYYNKFKCIAEKCKHNCCIGWEIDIDKDTLDKYKFVRGEFGKKLAKNIDLAEYPHFRLSENERCPFLNNDNLCEIIINLGENHLCQICSDHPRFRNFFDSREEMGIGLCCEAAAELIINKQDKTNFILLEGGEKICDSDETQIFSERENVFNLLQNRNLNVNERIAQLTDKYKIKFPYSTFSEWSQFLTGLERLDNEWNTYIEKLSQLTETKFENCIPDKWENAREQLLIYFVFRYMADGFYDGRIYERLAFAIISERLITAICIANGITDLNGLADVSRAYSCEIEYSEENIERMIDILTCF